MGREVSVEALSISLTGDLVLANVEISGPAELNAEAPPPAPAESETEDGAAKQNKKAPLPVKYRVEEMVIDLSVWALLFDELDMCHKVDFRGRLELDKPTITLADIMLEKMQIVQINEKDVKDTIIMLLEHRIGDTDKDEINGAYIADLLSKDWGYYHTVTTNIRKVSDFTEGYESLSPVEKEKVRNEADSLIKRIEGAKKSTK